MASDRNVDNLARLKESIVDAVRHRRFVEAEAWLRAALAEAPENADLLFLLGTVFAEAGKLPAAVDCFERLRRALPNNVSVLNNLGNTLRNLGQPEAAIAHLRHAVTLQPTAPDALVNLGYALQSVGATEEAVECGRAALRHQPHDTGAAIMLAVALATAGRHKDAIAELRQAVAVAPSDPAPHVHLAKMLLATGDFREGAAEYEWRWRGHRGAKLPDISGARWDGGMLGNDKTLLLQAERGAGDIVQFIRFAAPLHAWAGRVVLHCPTPMAPLLAGVPGLDEIVPFGAPLPVFDAYVPLLSLMHLLGTTPQTIPAQIPYLRPDPVRARALAPLLGDGFTVGLACADDGFGVRDPCRLPVADLIKKLLDVPGVRFVALQPGLAAALGPTVPAAPLLDLAPQLGDLAKLAAAISRLGLVITVDNAVAHLAGALGRPAWVLLSSNPDSRWLIGRTDTPWYPSLRLFRQEKPGVWQPVIDQIAGALSMFGGQRLLESHAAQAPAIEPPAAAAPLGGMALARIRDSATAAIRNRRFADAETLLRGALDTEPENAELRFLLGTVLAQSGRLGDAIALFEELLAALPDNFNVLNNLGNALRACGRSADAVPRLRRALALQPNSVEALVNLGHALRDTGQPADAVYFYRRALALRPDSLEARYYLARAYDTLGKLSDAETSYRHVMAQRPDGSDVLSRLGRVLSRQGRHDEAAILLEQVLANQPDNALALNDVGIIRRAQGRLDDAVTLFRHALAVRPDFTQALSNLGLALRDQGAAADAVPIFHQALALAPNDAGIHTNLALTLLTLGDLRAGSASYEWRLRGLDAPASPHADAPVWDGGQLGADKTLLLQAEQGLGDTIQFARYAPLLHRFAGRIVLDCAPSLVRLLKTAEGLDQIVPFGAALPPVDARVPMASLMHRLGTTLDTIPAAVPYLSADPDRIAALAPHIAGDEFKLGLVWEDDPQHPGDGWRSLPLAALKPWLDIPSVRFFSLQTGARAAELKDRPFAERIIDLGPHLTDLAETAAAIAQLDLVITVDTAVAHLAGALNRPAWVMLAAGADWRWMERRSDSPWYPSLRLFRQIAPGGWGPVVADIAAALGELLPRAAAQQPVSPKALNARGIQLGNQGRHAEAIRCFERAVALRPDYVEALGNLGNALLHQGRLGDAAIHHGRAVALQPDNADLICNLGATLLRLRRTSEAALCFERALALQPDHAAALNNLGSVRRAEHRLADAAGLYRRAAAIPSATADVHKNLGDVLRLDGDLDGAEAAYRRALALDPDFVDVLNELSIVLKARNQLDDAAACCRQALRLRPDFPEALTSLGNIQCAAGDFADGIAQFRHAIALKPDHAAAHLNLAIALLTLGDFRHGAAEYEWRWQEHKDHAPTPPAPLWDGGALPNGTLLLVAEQGLGDTIQFIRYAALLRPAVGRLILQCPPALAGLLASVSAVDRIVTAGESLPPVDAYVPLLSLMHVLDTVLETIPADTPYLATEPDRVAALAPSFAVDGLKVGLVWGGNPKHPFDRYRSLPLAMLQPLLDAPGTQFFSLQVGPRRAELDEAYAARIIDLSPQIADFADTAAALTHLDLVITVDTAIAHLAGALGRPTWVMLPASADWRWLLQRADTPWYPTLRLFRQETRSDWTGVVERLLPALLERVAAQGPNLRPETLNNLGLRLRRLGRFAGAADCFRRAIAARPDYPLAYNNLGLALQDQGRLDEGIAAHRQAVALRPSYADGHNNLAVALDRADRPDEALIHYGQALTLQPNHPEALTNFGNALRLAGRLDEAVAAQRRSLEIRPEHPDALNNLGFSLKTTGDLPAAIDCFRRAVAARPDFVAGHVNLGLALLTQGAFAEGTDEYEWRWRGYQGMRLPDLGQPLWDGTPLGADRTLLLWAEQGLGDTIQFVRYAPLLHRFAGRIVLTCQPALTNLLTRVPGIDMIVPMGGVLPPFDAYVPLMSLMHRLGTTVETIPASVPPYLSADPERVAAFAPRLGGAGFKVGLVWSGNPKHANDRHRSIPLSSLRPLLDTPGIHFFSLQVGPRAAEIATTGLTDAIADLAPNLADFADTAAVISQLDLVITVDTSVAHLAGALGQPTWLMLPWNADWRWLTERMDTPWYPGMTLFRQPRYDAWEPVIELLAAALAAGTAGETAAAITETTARR